jgi:ribosomal protein L15E
LERRVPRQARAVRARDLGVEAERGAVVEVGRVDADLLAQEIAAEGRTVSACQKDAFSSVSP